MQMIIPKILKELERSQRLLSSPSGISVIHKVLQDKDKYLYPYTRVSLCGRFNAGKSALINALLGEEIVISKMIPSTGVITRIYYSSSPKYSVEKFINGVLSTEDFDVTDIRSLTVKDNFANDENVKDIKQVNIGIPNNLLKTGIEIYDTPGLEDSDTMNKITHNQLDQSDFIVFVIDAMLLLKMKDIIGKYYKKLGRNVIFVINKMDMLNREVDRKDTIEMAKLNYSDYFNSVTFNSELFFVSADGDDIDVKTFTNFFSKHITNNVKEISAISRITILKQNIDEILSSIESDIALFSPTQATHKYNKSSLLHDKEVIRNIKLKLINQSIEPIK